MMPASDGVTTKTMIKTKRARFPEKEIMSMVFGEDSENWLPEDTAVEHLPDGSSSSTGCVWCSQTLVSQHACGLVPEDLKRCSLTTWGGSVRKSRI